MRSRLLRATARSRKPLTSSATRSFASSARRPAEVELTIDGKKVSIEAGVTTGWQKYTGLDGLNFGIDRFGESAPGHIVADTLGLTPSKIAKSIEKHLHTR